MRTRTFLLFGAMLISGCRTAKQPTKNVDFPAEITLFFTSDLHANLLAYNYATDLADPSRGLSKIATVVKSERAAHPCSLLLDGGDTLQGTPMGALYGDSTRHPHPMALGMRALAYDAAVVGNHDFDFGLATLTQFRADLGAPLLSANIQHARGEEEFPHAIVIERCGVHVGLLGLTTPTTATWEKPGNLGDLRFDDLLATAKREVPKLRERGAEIVVILAHAGPELQPPGDPHLATSWASEVATWTKKEGVPGENAVIAIARDVPGIDVILSGHTHQRIPDMRVNGVLITQPNSQGSDLAEVTLRLSKTGEHVTIDRKESRLLPVKDVAEDPQIVALAKPFDLETKAAMGAEIGHALAEMPGGMAARLGDGDLPRWINSVALEAAHAAGIDAQIACTPVFGDRALSSGAIHLRDLYGIYPYENTLDALEIKGSSLRAYLEKDATYLAKLDPHALPKSMREVKARPDGPDFNWDMCSGVSITLDLTKPENARVQSVSIAGKSIADTDSIRILVSNYRAGGGGGFAMFDGAKRLWSSPAVRDLLEASLKKSSIDPAHLGPCELTLLPDLSSLLPPNAHPTRCH